MIASSRALVSLREFRSDPRVMHIVLDKLRGTCDEVIEAPSFVLRTVVLAMAEVSPTLGLIGVQMLEHVDETVR